MSLKETLNRHNFKFNKQFGQNFISDGNLLAAIVSDAGITKEDTVVEIGAGAATLTEKLSDAAGKVVAFEIDRNLEPVISETLEGKDNVRVIFADALNYPDKELLSATGGSFKVVANLPYYITTPVIMKFAESDLPVGSVTVMVQEEVARRFCAFPGSADYGAITVALNLISNPKITRKVPRQMFYPVPGVDSAVVNIPIDRNKYDFDRKGMRNLIRAAFTMRRKTLVNNLIAGYGLTRKQAEEALVNCGFDPRVRGETLSAEQYLKLYEELRRTDGITVPNEKEKR